MRKLIITVILAGLMALATLGTAFATEEEGAENSCYGDEGKERGQEGREMGQALRDSRGKAPADGPGQTPGHTPGCETTPY